MAASSREQVRSREASVLRQLSCSVYGRRVSLVSLMLPKGLFES